MARRTTGTTGSTGTTVNADTEARWHGGSRSVRRQVTDRRECVDDRGAGHFAGIVPAHPVGDDPEPAFGALEHAVLVKFPLPADVGLARADVSNWRSPPEAQVGAGYSAENVLVVQRRNKLARGGIGSE